MNDRAVKFLTEKEYIIKKHEQNDSTEFLLLEKNNDVEEIFIDYDEPIASYTTMYITSDELEKFFGFVFSDN